MERIGTMTIQADNAGKTALHYAAESSELSVSELISSLIFRIDIENILGNQDSLQTSSTIDVDENESDTTCPT